jgi:hypothetical protein
MKEMTNEKWASASNFEFWKCTGITRGSIRTNTQKEMGPLYNFFGFNHEPKESIQLRRLKDPLTGWSTDPIEVGALCRKCSGKK